MKIKLKKEAPWDSVEAPTGQTINKFTWCSADADFSPFIKFIEFKLEEEDIDYDLSIEELREIANKNNIYSYMKSKEELIKKLKDNKIKMPKKIIEEKIDYSKYSKSELVSIAESKGIETKGMSKSKLIEAIENV